MSSPPEVVEGLRSRLAPRVEEIAAGLLGVEPARLRDLLVEKPGPDRRLALPRPRTVNVYVAVEAVGELVIRHEGRDDFVEFEVAGYRVPGILNTKVQAAERRALLRMLYDFYDRNLGSHVKTIVEAVEALGLSESGRIVDTLKSGSWRCYLAPKQGRKPNEEVVEAYCGFCPSCMIYGYAGMEEGGGYNVKSRVEGDVFYGLCSSSRCVVQRTFNAVNDATKTTFYGEGETGALYSLSLIEPGTVFVGKIAVRDPSLAELLAVLLAVANVERIGARQTHFGRVRTHIPAIVFSRFERGTGYEAAAQLLRESNGGPVPLEEALQGLTGYAEKVATEDDVVVKSRDLADRLRRLRLSDIDTVLAAAWLDSLVFKRSIELFITSKS